MANLTDPAHRVDVRVLGSVLRIACPDGAIAGLVREAWHLCALEGEPDRIHGRLSFEPPGPIGSEAARREMSRLTQRVTREAIRLQAGRYLLLHAGGLSDPRTGASIVYVARGGTGKTTLTRTLGSRYGYLSDETIAVDRRGRIEPYPKPLSVVRVAGRGKDEVAPRTLGLRGPPATPWLASLISLRRDATHEGPAQVGRVGLLDAIAMLSPETSSLEALREPLRTFADVIELAGGLRVVTYREAPQLAPVLHALLEGGR